jgi:hypothetical protein
VAKRDELSRKKYFQLCWEYLKRSDDYRDFCEWRKKTNTVIYPLNNLQNADIPQKFQSSINGELHTFFGIYSFWNDVFSNKFNRWWGLFQKGNRLFGAVAPFVDTVDEYFEDIMVDYHPNQGLSPKETMEELKKSITSYPRIVLDIRIDRSLTIESLQKEILRVFMQELKNKMKEKFWQGIWFYPTGRIRFDELERYLKIYDLSKKRGMKSKEIAAAIKVYSKRPFNESLRIVLKKEKKKAHNIIRNVERGDFPGKY